MRFELPAPRSQSLLVRILATAGALVCFGALVVFGIFALAILAVFGLAWLVWFRWKLHKMRKQATADADGSPTARNAGPGVIEGEYVVIREDRDNVH